MLRHVQLLQVCDAITGFLGNQRNIISKTEAISSTDHKGWCYFYQGTKLYHDNQARLPKMSINCNSNTTLAFATASGHAHKAKFPASFALPHATNLSPRTAFFLSCSLPPLPLLLGIS